jgi:hypothetical protein
MMKRLFILDDEQRERVLLLRSKGVPFVELARQFFVSVRQIQEILCSGKVSQGTGTGKVNAS